MKPTTWIILLAILLIGTWLRVIEIAQIPPGLYHDEAYSGLDALALVQGAGFPIFFEGNGGREPFFIYLHALSLLLFGIHPFALRIAAAFVGILTLPVFFVLVRALAADHKNPTGLALIASAGLATSYWHLNFSRVGWRTISLPLFMCLAFYFFWRSRWTGKKRDYMLCGIFTGVSLYTYLSARFLPIILALFWATELVAIMISRSGRWVVLRAWGQRVIPVLIAACAVTAPLAFYFLNHPQAFFFRVSDVTLPAEGNQVQAVVSNAVRVAQAFYSNGDPEWRHGISRRPILDWIIGVPFALGLLLTLLRWRKAESIFVLLWLAIMFLPTVLSKDAPDTQRAIGALPAVYLLVAWGMEGIGETLTSRLRIPDRSVTLGATVLVIIGSGLMTFRDYFIIWANDRHAYYDFQGDLADLADWINAQSENVIVPMESYAQPTIHFLTLPRFNRTRSIFSLEDVERNQMSVEPSLMMLPQSTPSGAFAVLRNNAVVLLDPSTHTENVLMPNNLSKWDDKWGKALVTIFPLPAATVADLVRPAPLVPYSADFGGRLRLVGYVFDRHITPGKAYPVTLYWLHHGKIEGGIKVFVHLLDSHGNVVAGVDEPLVNEYPPSLWPQGQVIPDHHVLAIDAAIPTGRYSLEVGLYQPSNNSRLALEINNSRVDDDRILFPSLKVAQMPSVNPLSIQPLEVHFGDAIILMGINGLAEKIKPGETFRLILLWKSLRPSEIDYTVFVHLLDPQGKIIAQADHQPQAGNYPTSIWDPGELVQDEITLTLPSQVPTGNLKIAIGLYELGTGQRLPIVGTGGEENGDQVILAVPVDASSN